MRSYMKKFFLYSTLVVTLFISKIKPEPIIINLGSCCQTSLQLRDHNFKREAFPFDWLLNNFNGLCLLLEEDFKDFLNPQVLEYKSLSTIYPNHSVVLNKKYNFEFRHDFPLNNPKFMDFYDLNLEKYTRRINRFYNVVKTERTFLIWCRCACFEPELTKNDAIRLRDILLNKFPEKNWTLILLDFSDIIKEPWNIDPVKNYYMPQPNSNKFFWMGDNQAWGEFFKLILNQKSFAKIN